MKYQYSEIWQNWNLFSPTVHGNFVSHVILVKIYYQSDLIKLQGDFHFSFGTSTKRSEQPQGDFFALQREPYYKPNTFGTCFHKRYEEERLSYNDELFLKGGNAFTSKGNQDKDETCSSKFDESWPSTDRPLR
jgi:hypothetical protein